MDLRRLRPGAAAGLAVLAVAGVSLPWWQAGRAPVLLGDGPPVPLAPDAWTGAELLGTPVTVALAISATAALVLTAVAWPRRTADARWARTEGSAWPGGRGGRTTRAVSGAAVAADGRHGRAARAVAAAVGGAAAAGAARELSAWGPSGALGAWLTGAFGAAAVVAAFGRPIHRCAPILAAALAGAVAVGVLPALDVPQAAADGPFVHLADLGDAGPLRSGATALPGTSDVRLTTVEGAVAAVADDGLAAVEHGRVVVLARIPPDDRGRHAGGILGAAGGRVVRFVAPGTLLVTGLQPGDPTAVRVMGVAEASPVGADGTVWLRGYGEPSGVVRQLDLNAVSGAIALDTTLLPLVTIDTPVGADPVATPDVVPVPGGALRRVGHSGSYRVERLAAEPGRVAVTPLAGGLDPACGLTAAARSASLRTPGPFAAAPDGSTWLAADGRLLSVGTDGVLRAVRAALPGDVTALTTTGDGTVVLATRHGALWALRPGAPMENLPPTRSNCVPAPLPAGPPVTLVPITNTGTDRLGAPLDVDGRWAAATRDGRLSAVSADGRTRTPLGTRHDNTIGPVWSDGSGGIWWLESGPAGLTPVHGGPGGAETRLPPVDLPADKAALIPDLGGRTPLLATPLGAYRIGVGTATRIVDGPVTGGGVRADGRGWLLAGGRLLALDGDRVLGPVIDGAAGPTDVPVAVQLAKNVPPDRLALNDASVALDARGRAIVLSDGVLIAVTVDGMVTPVAQDPRLTTPLTVEGGLVQRGEDGALLRVDLPG